MSQPCLVLSFGGEGTQFARQTIEVASSLGLSGVKDVIETNLGLPPASFEIRDFGGSVDTDFGLQRALASPSDGVCMLEVRIHPLWEKVQQLDAELKEMTARDKAVELAVQRIEALADAREEAQEARIMERVQVEVMKLQQSVQNVGDCQANNASLVPLVQCIAHEQIAVRSKVDELQQNQEAMSDHMSSQASLESELSGVRARMRAAENGLRTLQAEAKQLEQKCTEKVEQAVKTAAQQQSLFNTRSAINMDLSLDCPRATYSMKGLTQHRGARPVETPPTSSGLDRTVLEWGTVSRQLDRAGRGCQSLPQLF